MEPGKMDNSALQEAFRWLLEGVATIPIWPGTKKPALHSWQVYQTRLPTLDELVRWYCSPRSIAVLTGWRGLVVIDFDEFGLFVNWWDQYRPATRIVFTSRGAHVYFYITDPVKAHKLPGIDIKAAGGYVLAPPSIHPSGQAYQVFCDAPIMGIRNISDVLPAELKSADLQKFNPSTQYQPAIQPRTPIAGPVDPWDPGYNPRDLVSKIKERIRIRDLVPGPYVPRSNNTTTVRCPFPWKHLHGDQNPSAWICEDLQLLFCKKCMPARGWDAINLYGELHQLSNGDAIRELQRILSI
jgi:hypothetical protein